LEMETAVNSPSPWMRMGAPGDRCIESVVAGRMWMARLELGGMMEHRTASAG